MNNDEPIDLSVLVPVYNNAATLEELLDRIVAVLEPLGGRFEVVCVDDGSQDASLSLLRERAARDPRLRVFALVRNFGSQAASCAACEQALGRRLVHIDADLENYPEDIPRLLERMDRGFDLVCGYREGRKGSWFSRQLPSRLMNVYVRWRTGSDIRDVGCGLRAIDARLVQNLDAEGEARRLMTPVLLRRARSMTQVPVRYRPKSQAGGHSPLSLLGVAVDYYLATAKHPFRVPLLVSGGVCAAALVALLFASWRVAISLLVVGGLGVLLSLVGRRAQELYARAQMPKDLDSDPRSENESHHRVHGGRGE